MVVFFIFKKNIITISHRDEYIKPHQNPKFNQFIKKNPTITIPKIPSLI
nr:MAG TPA: hypothetical protein [Bacteriophage sp.]